MPGYNSNNIVHFVSKYPFYTFTNRVNSGRSLFVMLEGSTLFVFLSTQIPLSPKTCFEMLSFYCNCVVFSVSRYPVLYCIVFVCVYMLMGHFGFIH